jgi:hypothetical protein
MSTNLESIGRATQTLSDHTNYVGEPLILPWHNIIMTLFLSYICILALLASNKKIRLYNFITGAKDELVLALRISHTNTLTTNIKHILYTSALAERRRESTARAHTGRLGDCVRACETWAGIAIIFKAV